MNNFKSFYESHGYSTVNTGGNCNCLSKSAYYGNFIITSSESPSIPAGYKDISILSFEPLRGEIIVIKEGLAKDLIVLNPNKLCNRNKQRKVLIPFPEIDHNID